MFGSLKLGRPFGIDLYVHWTFWLLPLFVLFNGAFAGDVGAAAFSVVSLLAVFGCVALHEVGHALAARYYGIHTRDITLYPIGGVASLERIPERPLQEIVIALAGPAVNLAIALGLVGGLVVSNAVLPGAFSLSHMNPLDQFVLQLFAANVFLLVFNLIPAFPMDGGRVLRAILAFGLPRLEATRWAVGIGGAIAIGFLLLGLFGESLGLVFVNSTSLIFVGVVVFLLGQMELSAVQAQERRRWRQRQSEFHGSVENEDPTVRNDAFSGWKWDPVRRVWTEWRQGILVREVHMM